MKHWPTYAFLCAVAGALAGMPKVALIESDPIHAVKTAGTIRTIEPDADLTVIMVSNSGWWSNYPIAISNAVEIGCRIINLPAGMDVQAYSNNWYNCFDYARRSNVLVIAAAPNVDGQSGDYDREGFRNYPSHFSLVNVVTVTGQRNGQPIFSRSTNYFDLSAPAWDVRYSGTNTWSGNSAACALVTGAAIVIMDRRTEDTKRRLLDGVDVLPALAKHNRTSGALNLQRSLAPYVTVTIQTATNTTDWQSLSQFEALAIGQRFYRLEINQE